MPHALLKRRCGEDMLKNCPSTSLHRVSLLPLHAGGHGPYPLVIVPFTAPCTNAQNLRATLQAVLGDQLRGYSLALDAHSRQARVALYIHRGDLENAMHSLVSGLPRAEFGRAACVTHVTHAAGAEVLACH